MAAALEDLGAAAAVVPVEWPYLPRCISLQELTRSRLAAVEQLVLTATRTALPARRHRCLGSLQLAAEWAAAPVPLQEAKAEAQEVLEAVELDHSQAEPSRVQDSKALQVESVSHLVDMVQAAVVEIAP